MSLARYIKILSGSLVLFTLVNTMGVFLIGMIFTGGGGVSGGSIVFIKNIIMFTIESIVIGILPMLFMSKRYNEIEIEELNIKLLIICSIALSTFFMLITPGISLFIAHFINLYTNISILYYEHAKIMTGVVLSIIFVHICVRIGKQEVTTYKNSNYLFIVTSVLSTSFMLSKFPYSLNLFKFYLHNPLLLLSDNSFIYSVVGALFAYVFIRLLFKYFKILSENILVNNGASMICIVILVVSLSVIFPYFFMYASDTVTTLINILSHHSVHYSKCNFFAPYKLKTLLISLLGMTISYVIVRKSMCIKDR